MNDTVVIVALACGLPLLVVVAAFVGLMFTRRAKAMRALMSTPTKPVTELVDGERVKVVGAVRPLEGSTSTSKVSGRPGVGWEVQVSFARGDTQRGPLTVSECLPFELDDGTGVVRVEAAGAMLVLDFDHRAQVFEEDGAAPWLYALLEKDGLQLGESNRIGRFDLEEGLIEPGETVAVVGRVQGSGAARRLVADPEGGLIVSDDPDLHGRAS